jgi:hypothetical protein
MVVLAILVVGTFIETLIVVLRCTVFFIPYCAEKEWGLSIRQWLSETLPVLIAIILGNRPRP